MNEAIRITGKAISPDPDAARGAVGGSSAADIEERGTVGRHYRFSPRRILAICTNTLTELTRLKVFYFLLFFGLILIGGSVFLARFSFQQEFQILKDISLGAMSIFSSLLAIIATARLIPQDIEDRTIYSILAKPVPRFEYLLGKLGGVLLLLAIMVATMGALFLLVLYTREQTVLNQTARQMSSLPADQINQALQAVRASALNADLFPAIAIIYLKACLLASLALFVSTFATTNIFTVIVMVFIYFIGHLQATAREYWLHQHGADWLTRVFLAVVALMFPDLQAFNLVDEAVLGNVIPAAVFLKIVSLGVFYLTIYTALSVIVFSGKEL